VAARLPLALDSSLTPVSFKTRLRLRRCFFVQQN
jgi:hypothetical protein